MSRTPPVVLVAGLYAPGGGLTNVLTALIWQLARRFDVHGLGFRSAPVPVSDDVQVAGRPVHVQSSPARQFLPDSGWLERKLAEAFVDCVIVTGSAFLVPPLLSALQSHRPSVRIVLYLPVEGDLVNEDIVYTLSMVDACVLYTRYTLNNVASLCARAVERKPEYRAPRLFVCGHGVDTSRFHPLSDSAEGRFGASARRAARRSLFPDHPELEDAFIVLNANRFYYRKRLDITVAGFAEFARTHREVYLYLHPGQLSDKAAASLRKIIAGTGVAERILLGGIDMGGAQLSVEDLNLLYNACDVGLTTAMGEGWGLVPFEHAATGAAQILPDHTSFAENWSGAAELLTPIGREHVFYEYADMFVVSPRDVSRALSRLHDDAQYRSEMADAAYQRATEPRFMWSSVGRVFCEIVEKTMSEA